MVSVTAFVEGFVFAIKSLEEAEFGDRCAIVRFNAFVLTDKVRVIVEGLCRGKQDGSVE